jgi:hypothetical protein
MVLLTHHRKACVFLVLLCMALSSVHLGLKQTMHSNSVEKISQSVEDTNTIPTESNGFSHIFSVHVSPNSWSYPDNLSFSTLIATDSKESPNENSNIATSKQDLQNTTKTGVMGSGELLRDSPAENPKVMLTVVTAADKGHFLTLVGALWALRRTESPSTNIVVVDLGLTPCQRSYMEALTHCLPGRNRLQSFPYQNYPDFFNVSVKAGSYAWKPAIIHDMLLTVPIGSSVVWLDAGTETGRRISSILADSRSFQNSGFISSVTSGTVQQWTHKGMVDWFEAREGIGDRVRNMMDRERWSNNCNGAFLGFRRGSPAEALLVRAWYDCALDLNCIAPEGSSRRNHR